MTSKHLSRTALFSLLATSNFALTMEQAKTPSKAPKNYASDTISIFIPGCLPGTMKHVKAKVEFKAPEAARTNQQRIEYFASRVPETKKKLQTVLQAYLASKRAQDNIELLKVSPTSFYYNPDTNRLTLRQVWGKHKITENFCALLETRVACTYNPKTKKLSSGPLKIAIFQTNAGKQCITLVMDTLRELYPEKDTLNIRPETGAQVMQQSILQFMGGLITGTANDPEDYFNSLYVKDLKKLVAHFLAQQKTKIPEDDQ